MRERQAFTDKEKQDRTERTSDAARELIEGKRVARDAKTARLREQRLKAERMKSPLREGTGSGPLPH